MRRRHREIEVIDDELDRSEIGTLARIGFEHLVAFLWTVEVRVLLQLSMHFVSLATGRLGSPELCSLVEA
jgi:hypothetical protein